MVICGCVGDHPWLTGGHLWLCRWSFVAVEVVICGCVGGHLWPHRLLPVVVSVVTCGSFSGHLRRVKFVIGDRTCCFRCCSSGHNYVVVMVVICGYLLCHLCLWGWQIMWQPGRSSAPVSDVISGRLWLRQEKKT